MNWRIAPLLLPLITAAYAADEGVVQKPWLEFYIVPRATINDMERASANASDYATPPTEYLLKPFVKPQDKPRHSHRAIRTKKAETKVKPVASKPANPVTPMPCMPVQPEIQPDQHIPTYLKVIPQ